jgi:hypothetical protein
MSTANGSLYTPEHPVRPFRPGVFDDTLDAHPPYHLYDGPVTAEEIAAASEMAAQLGLISKTPSRLRAVRTDPNKMTLVKKTRTRVK